MQSKQFKTTINCGNCVKAVTGFLNEVKGIEEWTVDTGNPSKILTIKGHQFEENDVIEAVEDAGFDIEPVEK